MSRLFFFLKRKIRSLESGISNNRICRWRSRFCLLVVRKNTILYPFDRISGISIRSASATRPTCLCWCPPLVVINLRQLGVRPYYFVLALCNPSYVNWNCLWFLVFPITVFTSSTWVSESMETWHLTARCKSDSPLFMYRQNFGSTWFHLHQEWETKVTFGVLPLASGHFALLADHPSPPPLSTGYRSGARNLFWPIKLPCQAGHLCATSLHALFAALQIPLRTTSAGQSESGFNGRF